MWNYDLNTIKKLTFSGIGIHSGKKTSLSINFHKDYSGIIFKRIDIQDRNNLVIAHWRYISDTLSCTKLTNEEGVCVSTIEHLLSALCGRNIWNALVEIDGEEIPILDGSAIEFFNGLSGLMSSSSKFIRIMKTIEVGDEEKYVKLSPYLYSKFTVSLKNKSKVLDGQSFSFDFSQDSYEQVGCARTFGFFEDIEKLHAANLALGASLDNTIVIKNDEVMNEGKLRIPNECAAHKVLDAIGDLSLAGLPILGDFFAQNSSHHLNYLILQKLFSDPENYAIIRD